jgi:hypothetical protein
MFNAKKLTTVLLVLACMQTALTQGPLTPQALEKLKQQPFASLIQQIPQFSQQQLQQLIPMLSLSSDQIQQLLPNMQLPLAQLQQLFPGYPILQFDQAAPGGTNFAVKTSGCSSMIHVTSVSLFIFISRFVLALN